MGAAASGEAGRAAPGAPSCSPFVHPGLSAASPSRLLGAQALRHPSARVFGVVCVDTVGATGSPHCVPGSRFISPLCRETAGCSGVLRLQTGCQEPLCTSSLWGVGGMLAAIRPRHLDGGAPAAPRGGVRSRHPCSGGRRPRPHVRSALDGIRLCFCRMDPQQLHCRRATVPDSVSEKPRLQIARFRRRFCGVSMRRAAVFCPLSVYPPAPSALTRVFRAEDLHFRVDRDGGPYVSPWRGRGVSEVTPSLPSRVGAWLEARGRGTRLPPEPSAVAVTWPSEVPLFPTSREASGAPSTAPPFRPLPGRCSPPLAEVARVAGAWRLIRAFPSCIWRPC